MTVPFLGGKERKAGECDAKPECQHHKKWNRDRATQLLEQAELGSVLNRGPWSRSGFEASAGDHSGERVTEPYHSEPPPRTLVYRLSNWGSDWETRIGLSTQLLTVAALRVHPVSLPRNAPGHGRVI